MKLIKRLMSNDEYCGFIIQDNSGLNHEINNDQAFKFAQSKLIDDVSIRFDNGKPILFGLHGFSITELPVERKDNIIVEAIYKSGNEITGYQLNDGHKSVKVGNDWYKKYYAIGKINKKSISRAKVISDTTVNNLMPVYKEFNLRAEAIDYINIIKSLETGDKTEIDKVSNIVRQVENEVILGKMSESEFRQYLSTIIGKLRANKKRKEDIYINNAFNGLTVELSKDMNRINALSSKNKKELSDGLKNLASATKELAQKKDFATFRLEYAKVKSALNKFNALLNRVENQQQSEDKHYAEIYNTIKNEENNIPANDKLKKEKYAIIRAPWYFKLKGLLYSSKGIENCFIKRSDDKVIMSYRNIVVESTNDNKMAITCKGNKTIYNMPLNNMNILAGFIREAEKFNLLANNKLALQINTNGQTRVIDIALGKVE